MNLTLPRQLILTLLVTTGLAYYPLTKLTDEYVRFATHLGAVIMTLNALAGYLAIEKSFHKQDGVFYKYIFGGMVVRLFLLAIILLLVIKIFHVHIAALIFTMFFYYIVYTILEIVYIQKKAAVHHTHS